MLWIRISQFTTLAAVIGSCLFAQIGLSTRPSIGLGVAAPTAAGGRPYPIAPGYPPPTGLNPPAAAYTGIRPGAYNSRNTFNGGYGAYGYKGGSSGHRGSNYGRYNRAYPALPFSYIAAPYYYPFFDSGSPFPEDYGPGPDYPPEGSDAQASLMAQEALGQQLAHLSAQVEELKNNQQNAQQPQFQPPEATPQATPEPPPPPVTLVLRSGVQVQVQNYAVMSGSFWDFSSHPAKRIPLSQIDVDASTKATEANGGEFPSIGSTSPSH
jgi:hypothetical protein